MDTQSKDARRGAAASPAQPLEGFARNLLQVIQGIRMYPPNHPSLEAMLKRLSSGIPFDHRGRFSVGVTQSELFVGGVFAGGEGSRAAALAGLLHGRGVGRLVWTREARSREVLGLAEAIARTSAEGADLRDALHANGIFAVGIEPVDLARIHEAAVPGESAATVDAGDRRRNAWLWLQNAEPAELAEALASQEFWESFAHYAPGSEGSLANVLAQLGERLEVAIQLLEEDARERVLAQLTSAGKTMTPAELALLVRPALGMGGFQGPGLSAILKELTADRFLDLLAALVAAGDCDTGRLADVFRRFAPSGGAQGALAAVRARLAPGDDGGFAADVWRSVEEFLLRLEEDPFMAAEYAHALETLSEPSRDVAGLEGRAGLEEDPSLHLDWVFLGVACDGGPEWREQLLDRAEQCAAERGPFSAMEFVIRANELLPGLSHTRPALIRSLFRQALGSRRNASPGELRSLFRFCALHEAVLLDTALRVLMEEQRISVRRLLVDVLSSFSDAATPVFVSRARAGPWYLSRNLAIVLGRQGKGRAVPVLQELARHSHAKVRNEARRALAALRAATRPQTPNDRSLGTATGERTDRGA